MTKIVMISDTHLSHNQLEIPECDLLIHAGDFSFVGKMIDVIEVNQWFGKLKERGTIKEAVLISGNHDWIGEKNPSWTKEAFTNCIYLDDSGIDLMGLKIWGSPVQPEFCNWAFNRKRGEEIARHWAKIPDDTQILISHGPPFGILDECPDMGDITKPVHHVGCEELLKAVKRIKPRFHIFGHIHEGYGQVTIDGTTFVNAAIMDGQYNPVNKPITINI